MLLSLIILGAVALIALGVLLLFALRLSPPPTNRSDVIGRIRRLQ